MRIVRSFMLSPVGHTDESNLPLHILGCLDSRLFLLVDCRLLDLDSMIFSTRLFDFDGPQHELWVALLHLLDISPLRRRTFFALGLLLTLVLIDPNGH